MRVLPSAPLFLAACLLRCVDGRLRASDGEEAAERTLQSLSPLHRRYSSDDSDFRLDFDRHRKSRRSYPTYSSKSGKSTSSKSGKSTSRSSSKSAKSKGRSDSFDWDQTSSRDEYRPGRKEVVLAAEDDAFVDRSDPNENFGDLDYLAFDRDVDTLIKFDLSRLEPRIRRDMREATLQLYSLEDCDSAMRIEVVAGNWDEDRVTWRSAPDHHGPKSSEPRNIPRTLEEDEWAEVDVKNGVRWSVEVEDQSYATFRISTRGNEECALASKEYMRGRYAPTLELRFDGSGGSKYGKYGGKYGGKPGRRPQKRPNGRQPTKWKRVKANASAAQFDAVIAPRTYDVDSVYANANRAVWKVSYDLGAEGRCFVTDTVETWEVDEVYDAAGKCCEQKLWWMSERQCLGPLFCVAYPNRCA